MEQQPNPYAHLNEAELTELRYQFQERYERVLDFYHGCYEEWAVVMNALKMIRESNA